jgi:hypothetical protein
VGLTASSTRGSARQDSARETPIQIEPRVRGSLWSIVGEFNNRADVLDGFACVD